MKSSSQYLIALILIAVCSPSVLAATFDPAAKDYSGNKGKTIYVSKQGDNSDGSSWAKAFTTIQAGLSAVPNDKGGHRVIIRPDTYPEANLHPAHSGTAGAYCEIVGDSHGRYGSGAKGWVIIDSGCPGVAVRQGGPGNPMYKFVKSDKPETGLKCVDWWGNFKCDPHFSGTVWDRWIFRNLYWTGSEGGGWDLTSENGAEFTAIVEGCVGIGRFAGACVMAHKPRKGEPVVYRNSWFMNLDWWGDAGALYVRGESKTMPQTPHAVLENCTLISPDNAIQAGYPGVDKLCSRVKLKDCRLIVLNFSQPRGTPSSGIICCGCKDGKQLHVDFEDCSMMGFKIFGTRAGQVSYTVKGTVEAYVQFEQPTPQGFKRLGLWPVELTRALSPPEPGQMAGRP